MTIPRREAAKDRAVREWVPWKDGYRKASEIFFNPAVFNYGTAVCLFWSALCMHHQDIVTIDRSSRVPCGVGVTVTVLVTVSVIITNLVTSVCGKNWNSFTAAVKVTKCHCTAAGAPTSCWQADLPHGNKTTRYLQCLLIIFVAIDATTQLQINEYNKLDPCGWPFSKCSRYCKL